MDDLSLKLSKLEEKYREHVHDGFDGTQKLPDLSFVTQTSIGGGVVFIANRPCFIQSITEIHAVTATGATVVEKLTGTTGVGSGTNILISNFALTVARDTVTKGILINKNGIALSVGDRIGTWVSGSSAGISYQCITFEIIS